MWEATRAVAPQEVRESPRRAAPTSPPSAPSSPASLLPSRRRPPSQDAPRRQVRRDDRGPLPSRRRLRHADQQVRGTVVLPHGTGQDHARAVFAEGTEGPMRPGEPAPTSWARRISVAGSRRGLFELRRRRRHAGHDGRRRQARPHPRSRGPHAEPQAGTVTIDVAKAVTDAKAGKVEYRSTARHHPLPIGRPSFGEEKLVENYDAVLDAIVRAKPSAAKGEYPKSINRSPPPWAPASDGPRSRASFWRRDRRDRVTVRGAARHTAELSFKGAPAPAGCRRSHARSLPLRGASCAAAEGRCSAGRRKGSIGDACLRRIEPGAAAGARFRFGSGFLFD